MDTSTHVITGVGLAGLSHLDPTVANHPELLSSILFCTVIGSNAPDLDFLYKYKGNEIYVQKHRGMSHSLYSQIMLSAAIASLACTWNNGMFFLTFFMWSFLAVLLHVLFDICNIYGTQAFRPWNSKWIALSVLPIFDPFIMIVHLLGIGLWLLGIPSGHLFLSLYILIILYIFYRYYIYIKVLRRVASVVKEGVDILLIPTLRLNNWGIIASDIDHYKLGRFENKRITWTKVLDKVCEKNEVIRASRDHWFVDYLLDHSSYLHAKIVIQPNGYEVHWYDLRYQSKIDEPFIAIVTLDSKLNLVNSKVKRGLIAAPETA